MSMSSPQLTPQQYLTERVEQYQGWYDKKAVATKRLHLRMRGFSVVGGGLVPVLINIKSVSVSGVPVVQVIVTIISLLVVIVVSLESVFHYREQWKNYRSTEQRLGHEKFLYRSRVGRYCELTDEKAFRLLVERVEDAIATENSSTLNVMTMANEPEGTKHHTSE